MSLIRRDLPVWIAFLVGVIILADYVFTFPGLQVASTTLTNWAVIVTAFSFGIGALNIIQRQSKIIIRRDKYWIYSVVLIIILFGTLGIGLVGSINHPYYKILFDNVMAPLNVTMSSMLAFFLASAAFRVFRAKNFESILLLIAAVFVMLQNAPIGELIWPGLPVIGDFFVTGFAAGGNRGIQIGAAIASIGFGVRILIGQEKRWFGRTE